MARPECISQYNGGQVVCVLSTGLPHDIVLANGIQATLNPRQLAPSPTGQEAAWVAIRGCLDALRMGKNLLLYREQISDRTACSWLLYLLSYPGYFVRGAIEIVPENISI
jgi:hypothetical protein